MGIVLYIMGTLWISWNRHIYIYRIQYRRLYPTNNGAQNPSSVNESIKAYYICLYIYMFSNNEHVPASSAIHFWMVSFVHTFGILKSHGIYAQFSNPGPSISWWNCRHLTNCYNIGSNDHEGGFIYCDENDNIWYELIWYNLTMRYWES